MSQPTPQPAEVLHKPRRRWLQRLWVKVSLVLALIALISFLAWWSPRRTMVWLWWNNASVYCAADRERAADLIDLTGPGYSNQLWQHFSTVLRAFGWLRTDREITHVNLQHSSLTTDDLLRMKNLQKLESASLHDRQLGVGLDLFQHLPEFKVLSITGASKGHLAELKRVPQLESLSLWNLDPDAGLAHVVDLPKLKSLFLGDCPKAAPFLQSIPDLPQVEDFVLQNCSGFDTDDLRFLARLPNIKYMDLICRTETIDDTGIEHISQLKKLEVLALRTPWTDVSDAGLEKLVTMPSLKELIILRSDYTPDQLDRLNSALPNCKVTVH